MGLGLGSWLKMVDEEGEETGLIVIEKFLSQIDFICNGRKYLMHCQYSPSFGREALNDKTEQLSVPAPLNNPKRQVSLMYGMEFSSKVPLFQRTYSAIQECGLALLSQEEVHNKVHSFLIATVEGQPEIKALLANFKEMEEEMALSVSRSKRSVSSQSQSSFSSSDKEVNVLRDFSNQNIAQPTIIVHKVNRTRASMMKSNRISIADAIKITELQEFKQLTPLESINSLSSVQSDKQTPAKLNRNFQILSHSSSQDSSKQGKKDLLVVPCKERKNKISIMMGDLDSNSQFDSEIFSEQGEPLTLKDLNPPELPFNLAVLQSIFDSPCPFLVNLSLCLLCKCLARSGISLNQGSVGWMLSISTIVAYKIYYDEPITGLIEYYCSLLGLQKEQVILLERWFLQQVGYQVVVSSRQYQSVLFQLSAR